MSNFQVNDDDVVSMNPNYSLINLQTFTLSQLVNWLASNLWKGYLSDWLKQGTECKLLSPTGGGWQQGKIRIRFEFIPDEPPPSKADNSDSLDSLRSQINS